MRLITLATFCGRTSSALRQLVITITFTFVLLLAAGHAAAATPPELSSVAPWSARCYTDTCVGFTVTFESGHTVTLGYPADAPASWAIREAADMTKDEAAFAQATVSALERRDLSGLAAVYSEIPPWYMDSLAAYVAPDHPVYRRWLPLVSR